MGRDDENIFKKVLTVEVNLFKNWRRSNTWVERDERSAKLYPLDLTYLDTHRMHMALRSKVNHH